MKDYNYNENREEQSAREIGKKFAELGFGTVMTKAVGFIVFPFIAYLVSYVSEKIYTYFEENAY